MVLGTGQKQLHTYRLVLLAAGGVARSLQTQGHGRRARCVLPAVTKSRQSFSAVKYEFIFGRSLTIGLGTFICALMQEPHCYPYG